MRVLTPCALGSHRALHSRSPLWGQGLELKEAVQETEHKYNSCGSGEDARVGVGGTLLNPLFGTQPPLVP